jgi:hypothetical protein
MELFNDNIYYSIFNNLTFFSILTFSITSKTHEKLIKTYAYNKIKKVNPIHTMLQLPEYSCRKHGRPDIKWCMFCNMIVCKCMFHVKCTGCLKWGCGQCDNKFIFCQNCRKEYCVDCVIKHLHNLNGIRICKGCLLE